MTQAVYIVGGAGAGKSTLTSEIMDSVVMQYGPLTDLLALPNVKNVVTFRGHPLHDYDGRSGLYVGVMREQFPGTDGLDRASSPVGSAWLRAGDLPDFIIAEGATLATRPFLTALHETTDLLLVHLHCDLEEKQRRFARRGSNQDPKFVTATTTRAANLLRDLTKLGVHSLSIDTEDHDACVIGRDLVETFLKK